MAARDVTLSLLGLAILGGGMILVGLGAPTAQTEVAATGSDVDSLANETPRYSPADLEPRPISALSPAERSAIREARESPRGIATGRTPVLDETALEYRSDVTSEYVIEAGEELVLVRVVLDVEYVLLGLGLVTAVVGALLIIYGTWGWVSRRRADPA